MKVKTAIICALMLSAMACTDQPEKPGARSGDIEVEGGFDLEAATKIIERRTREFEEALKAGDSIAVGDLYTLDTKIVGAYSGRENIIKEVYEMTRDSITGIKFTVVNVWGGENIIVEDAYVEFFHENGTSVSKGECLLVWKKEEDAWRIFRDVFKPEKN